MAVSCTAGGCNSTLTASCSRRRGSGEYCLSWLKALQRGMVSIHPLGWRNMVHLLVKRLIDHCPISELPLRVLNVWLVEEGQRVLHPIHVVSIREIFLGV